MVISLKVKSAAFMLAISILPAKPQNVLQETVSPKYSVKAAGGITGSNTGRYNNRPLYINNTDAFVLTGDQPLIRLGKGQNLFGTFMMAIERDEKTRWLQHCDGILSEYQPGTMSWEITDTAFPGLKIHAEVVPMAKVTGMAIRVEANEMHPGDSLIWAFGGAQERKGQNLSWKLDVMGQPELLSWGFTPGESNNNRVETNRDKWVIHLVDSTGTSKIFTVAVTGNRVSKVSTGDAGEWTDPSVFVQSRPKNLPILKGKAALVKGKPVTWAIEILDQPDQADQHLQPDQSPKTDQSPRTPQSDQSGLSAGIDPDKVFDEGIKRIQTYIDRLKINTPDPFLNAAAGASLAAVDGTWYPPVFHHGAMQWNIRLPGWRTIFGGTMYGWHDRVKEQARFYIESQVKESDKKEAKADPALLMTGQHADSRFYGVGRIKQDQGFYDMQSQFFDQLIEEYRWTADPELVKLLRPALELHLLWMRDCFDPDGDGLYESYINTWPSDSQWYNGGGSAEETSYAYRGHEAARDMARNDRDSKAEQYHALMMEKIRYAFFKKLWINGKGHSGSYIEQGGLGRLHENPWLYSIFLPVDAGLTSEKQAIESVYYSEWALQNDRVPSGGRKVWTSNWTPGIWSVRELWPGDNYHLAIAYFLAGLPDDGYDIMRGTYMYSAFDHLVPGNLGSIQGGIDFGDCVHTFSRTLVEGLFGYHPDYPNGRVRLTPQFPSSWNHASIEIPDVKISFSSEAEQINYSFILTRPAKLEILLPVKCTEVKKVTVNGKMVSWELLPGVGVSKLHILITKSDRAEVVIETGGSTGYYPPETINGNIGEIVQLQVKDARIIEVEDPQGALDNEKTENGKVLALLAANKGFHTVITLVETGKFKQWRVFRIRIDDPEGDRREQSRCMNSIPKNPHWQSIDISNKMNADITTIYRQEYLSPRPNTVSVRLGTDGYSPWTFPYWKSVPPEINLNRVNNLLNSKHQLVTFQGVPFIWNKGEVNVAFTSIWDNYPRKIDFPVNKTGEAVYFLVSGSTNVMQCQIANAVISLNYADGTTDSLELVPPVNYWNLSTIDSHATAPGQGSRIDYTSETDEFCLPAKLPETVQLGDNCRAMLLNLKLRKGIELKSISLETLSQEVVVGLIGITVL